MTRQRFLSNIQSDHIIHTNDDLYSLEQYDKITKLIIANSLYRFLLYNEDAIDYVRYKIMVADCRYSVWKNKSRKTYLSQWGNYAIRNYIRHYKRFTKKKGQKVVRIDSSFIVEDDETYSLRSQIPEKHPTKSSVNILKLIVAKGIEKAKLNKNQRGYLTDYFINNMTPRDIAYKYNLQSAAPVKRIISNAANLLHI